jgi:hypothetical protein
VIGLALLTGVAVQWAAVKRTCNRRSRFGLAFSAHLLEKFFCRKALVSPRAACGTPGEREAGARQSRRAYRVTLDAVKCSATQIIRRQQIARRRQIRNSWRANHNVAGVGRLADVELDGAASGGSISWATL